MTSLAQLERGVVGYWCPMLATTGLRLYDRSVRKNHGTLTNMDPGTDWVGVTVRGRSGVALDFDNSDDVVSIPHLWALDSGNHTISFWYFTPTISGLNQIGAQWTAVGAIGPIIFRNGAAIAWQIGTSVNRVTTANILTANSWHFISCIRGPSLRVICNGVLDSGSTTPGSQSNTEPFLLGGPVSGAGTGAGNCRIADLVIHNRALTVSEHVGLYRLGPGWFGRRENRRRYAVAQAAGVAGPVLFHQHYVNQGWR